MGSSSTAAVAEEHSPLLPIHSSSPSHPASSVTAPPSQAAVVSEIEVCQVPVQLPVQDPESDNPKREKEKNQRLVSLDVFRGITVALMILVDDAGGAFPAINHSPWFGVTLADFVMPFFLFIIGVAIALVFKKVSDKPSSTKKVTMRAIKLFILGVVLQGGYFHGRDNLTYGVDLDRIRWLGVLQRIAIGYFLAAMAEIWLVCNTSVDSLHSFAKKYIVQWILAVLVSVLYVCLLLELYVPTWSFEVSTVNSTFSSQNNSSMLTVNCGTSGNLGPPCNAVGLIDRLLLGEKHLYQHPVYKRTKECSANSPDYGPLPINAPAWCLAPFDPEGLLSTLMAAISCFAGLHFGHIIVHCKNHEKRMLLWFSTSLAFVICGFLVQISGMPFSKPLYTLSYMFLTAGASGVLLCILYYIVDVVQARKPLVLFQWMGMNALIVFVLAACDVFPILLQGFYWRRPENNLVNLTEHVLQIICRSKRWGTLAFVLLEIFFWCFVAGILHRKGVFIKM